MKFSRKSIHTGIKALHVILLLAIAAGFFLQSWNVIVDYFHYATKTTVTMEDFPEMIKPPILVNCVKITLDPTKPSKLEEIFEKQLNDPNNTWNVIDRHYPALDKLTPNQVGIQVRKFLKEGKYCVSWAVSNEMSRDELLSITPRTGYIPYFYEATLSTQPFYSKLTFHRVDAGCGGGLCYFQVFTDEGDVYFPATPLVIKFVCTKGREKYFIRLGFTMSKSTLLPSPYDTNCRDYNASLTSMSKLLSSRKSSAFEAKWRFKNSKHCFDECIKQRTQKWNIVPDMTVIFRDRYKNSDYDIGLGRVILDEKIVEEIKQNSSFPPELVRSYASISKEWNYITYTCQRECGKVDCVSKHVLPYITYLEEGVQKESQTLGSIQVVVSVPHTQIMTIQYEPQQPLIEFLIYLFSGLSFWIGFCPWTLTMDIEGKLIKYLEKKKNNVDEMTISDEERKRLARVAAHLDTRNRQTTSNTSSSDRRNRH